MTMKRVKVGNKIQTMKEEQINKNILEMFNLYERFTALSLNPETQPLFGGMEVTTTILASLKSDVYVMGSHEARQAKGDPQAVAFLFEWTARHELSQGKVEDKRCVVLSKYSDEWAFDLLREALDSMDRVWVEEKKRREEKKAAISKARKYMSEKELEILGIRG